MAERWGTLKALAKENPLSEADWHLDCRVWASHHNAGNQWAWLEILLASVAAEKRPPVWAIEQAAEFFEAAALKGLLNKKGRSQSLSGRKHALGRSLNRWAEVDLIIWCQGRDLSGEDEVRTRAELERRRATYNNGLTEPVEDFGSTNASAFEIASLKLRGTQAAGEPSAIERDWRLVEGRRDVGDAIAVGPYMRAYLGEGFLNG